MDNQQPILEQGKVQRLSRKRVGFKRIRSGGHPKKDEDIVCAYAKV